MTVIQKKADNQIAHLTAEDIELTSSWCTRRRPPTT